MVAIIFIALQPTKDYSREKSNWMDSKENTISIDKKISDHYVFVDETLLYERFEKIFNLQKDSAVIASGLIRAKCVYDEKKYGERARAKIDLLNMRERRSQFRKIIIPLSWFRKESIVLVGQDSQIWAKIIFKDDALVFSDTLIIQFPAKEVTEQKVYLPTEVVKKHYRRVDDSLNISLIRVADNVVYYSLIINGATFSLDSLEIGFDWKLHKFDSVFHNYIPLLKICDGCNFHKIDTDYFLSSGQVNVTKEMFDFLKKHNKKSYFEESDIMLRYSASKLENVAENIETKD